METLAAVLGNLLSGRVTVPLNPALGEKELGHVLADARPAALFAAEPSALSGVLATAARLEPSGHGPGLREPDPAAPALVLYTSGTTGPPKGAVLTAGNVSTNLAVLREVWAWTDRDVLVHALPLFHVHGLVLGALGALAAGSALRLLPRFSPEVIVEAFSADATMLFAVPTMFHRLAAHLEATPAAARPLSRARLLVSGSAALPAREHQRFAALTGQSIAERYGLTETLINTAVPALGPRRAGVVGRPLPGVELRLLRGDDGPGEVCVRGPNVFAGYLNRPDATAAAFGADGFFLTGDLGVLEPDGSLRLVGRKATDLIKTGGFKVGAGEVEAALLDHPAVAEAAVIGAPDPDLGERIVAFVVAREGFSIAPGVLEDHVAGALGPHKRPREVHVRASLPRNPMGKVLKRDLARDGR